MSTIKVDTITDTSGNKSPYLTGSVLQVVQAIKTDTTSSTSTSFEDVSGLSVNITPRSSSSKILIMVSFCWAGANNSSPKFKLAGGNSTTFVGDAASNRQRVSYYAADDYFNGASNAGNETAFMGFINYLDSPSSTSQQTYKLQAETDGNGAYYINRTGADVDDAGEGGRSASSIIVMEIGG